MLKNVDEAFYYAINLYYVDDDKCVLAAAMADRHLVTLPHYYAQLLSIAHHRLKTTGIRQTNLGRNLCPAFYQEHNAPYYGYWSLNGQRIYADFSPSSYVYNHPLIEWLLERADNYDFMYSAAMLVAEQFRQQHNGRMHTAAPVLWALEVPPAALPYDGTYSVPPLVMPEEFYQSDPVRAYRAYYARLPRLAYSNRRPPPWLAKLQQTTNEEPAV